MSGGSITLPAFAKINLGLRITGRRADGYHEIDTLMQTISLHDTINFTVSDNPEIILSCDDRSLTVNSDNLVYRAADALRVHFASEQGARIRLVKRIPTQAGLGGGSSDSAITILALTYLWQLQAEAEELVEIAGTLGADVPFFFFGGRARGTGIGQDLLPMDDAAEKCLIVIKPNANISTAQAYASLNARSLTSTEAKTILSSSDRGVFSPGLDQAVLPNDFEPIAFELQPEVKRAKMALMNAGAETALLAGSGAAVFGIFASRGARERALGTIEIESGWRVFPCSTVGRNHYRNALGPGGAILERLTGT